MPGTVALRQITEPGPELKALFAALNRELEVRGIKVILLPPQAGDGVLLELWKVDVAIALTQAGRTGEGPPVDSSICFYYSWKRREESLAVIAAIVREMLFSGQTVAYSLARSWDFLKQYLYFRCITNSRVPAVLAELRHFSLTPEEIKCLTGWIVNGVINHYGRRDEGTTEEETESLHFQDVVGQGGDDGTTAEEPERTPPPNEDENPIAEGRAGLSEAPPLIPEEVEREVLRPKEEAVEQSLAAEQGTIQEESGCEEEAVAGREISLTALENGGCKASVPSPPKQLKIPAPGKRRYWGTNPLSPPGDGPVHFFKSGTPELPPGRPDVFRLYARASAFLNPSRAATGGGMAGMTSPTLVRVSDNPHDRVLYTPHKAGPLEPAGSSPLPRAFAELKDLAASLPDQEEASSRYQETKWGHT